MPRCTRWLIASLVLVFSFSPLLGRELPTAKPEEVGLSSAGLHKVQAEVQELINKGQVAGAITLVARKGKVVHFEAQGLADVDSGKPMKKDAILRIYSMSKPITTVAAMILWEEGRFKLDDPVSRYLPEFKGLKVYKGGTGTELELVAADREPTIRDLMRHTSGLTYGVFGNTPVDQLYRKHGILDRGDTLAEMVAKLGKIPLAYQPGTAFRYSVSTDVLGRLVEVVSKKPFDQFLQERLFTPLDMKDTGFHVPEKKWARLAATHGRNEGGKLIVTDDPAHSRYRQAPRLLSGGGGLVSTARDYARFCQMLLSGGELHGKRILKAATVRLMTRNHLPDKALPFTLGNVRKGVGFGLGFSVRLAADPDLAGNRLGEYGWGGAASTHFWISPRDDLFVIAMQQFMPYQPLLENRLKPIIYEAIQEQVNADRPRFVKQVLTSAYFCDGISNGDINRDGKQDIVAGPFWYEGPGFTTKHAFYPPKALEPAASPSNSMYSYVHDFNGDGWLDILVLGRVHLHRAYWYENPKGGEGLWKQHFVFQRIRGESPPFVDIDQDGRPELIGHWGGCWGLIHPDRKSPYQPWLFKGITPAGDYNQFYHGTGVGDVNGDGRLDLILNEGWWEQPAPGAMKREWTLHPFRFASRGGAQMFAYDVDGDSDNDIITSLDAHGWGLAWFEQVQEEGKITFRKHLIMGDRTQEDRYGVAFSQPHALALGDLDGDGLEDIVVGKRRWAHGPKGDIEPNAAPVVYWFQLVRAPGRPVRFVPHQIDDRSGVGVQITVADVAGDGRPEVLTASKLGSFVFHNRPQGKE